MKKRLKITLNSPLVLCFSMACVLATAAGYLTDRQSTILLFSTHASGWGDPLTYLRLFTHVLGHADLNHLIGNLAYILLLGPMLEEKYGWKRLLVVILVTAALTGAVHNLLFPGTILLGASGVVFAFILMTSFAGFREGEIPLTFILVALIFLGREVWDGIAVKDNISNLTHILGGLVGGGAGYVLQRKGKKSGSSHGF